MDSTKIIGIILQLVALAPSLLPAIQQAIQSLKDLTDTGHEITQADIDALVAKVQTQSNEIQSL